jgi:hypothetical protein
MALDYPAKADFSGERHTSGEENSGKPSSPWKDEKQLGARVRKYG